MKEIGARSSIGNLDVEPQEKGYISACSLRLAEHTLSYGLESLAKQWH